MISKAFNLIRSIKRKYYTFRVKRVAKSCGNDLTVNNYSYVTSNTSLGIMKAMQFHMMRL